MEIPNVPKLMRFHSFYKARSPEWNAENNGPLRSLFLFLFSLSLLLSYYIAIIVTIMSMNIALLLILIGIAVMRNTATTTRQSNF